MEIPQNARRTAVRPDAGADVLRANIGRRHFVNEISDAPIDRVLPRLQGVRQTGADRWVARCSGHDDRRPSLAIRVLPDGRVLVHCHAGCGIHDVLRPLGLDLHDLFPAAVSHYRPAERRPWRDAGHEALRALVDEVNLVFAVAARMCAGMELIDSDRDALALACERVNAALLLIEGGRYRA